MLAMEESIEIGDIDESLDVKEETLDMEEDVEIDEAQVKK